MDDFLIDLGLLVIGALGGFAGARYQGRADRRDAERFRRETAAVARADVKAEPSYDRRRIILRNDGPADATKVDVPEVKGGPGTWPSGFHRMQKWPLPADIPANASLELLVRGRENIGDWMDLTIVWADADGTPRKRLQRINWAG